MRSRTRPDLAHIPSIWSHIWPDWCPVAASQMQGLVEQFRPGFGATEFLLVGSLGRCRTSSSIPGLCPLERAAPLLSSCNNSYIPSHGRISPGTESPQWRTTVRPAVISEPLERNTVGISKVGMTLMLILLEDESEKNSNVGDYVLQGTL